MKILYDLPIRIKFAVVLVPLIVIILCFDYLQIKHNYDDYADAQRLNRAIVLGVEINNVVHEIQRERSISVGVMANNGQDFDHSLEYERQRTDSTLRQFYHEVQNTDFKSLLKLHKEDIDFLKSNFERLQSIRTSVDRVSMEPLQMMAYFSDLNELALNTVDKLINETRDKDVAQQVHALIYFLKAKERASIERAVGTQAFSDKTMSDALYSRYSALVAEQNSYLDAFLVIADEESQNIYKRDVRLQDINEIERLRKELDQRTDLKASPGYWYEITTNRVNALKQVEDDISTGLLKKTDQLATTAFRKFWLFILLDIVIGVSAMWLMYRIVTNLLTNVRTLENFTKLISQGDLSQKVQIATKDEIGQYAKTFNVMVDEINKSHDILRKERDKAKYLYNNIYRVSLVIFENIQQGVFLLDRNFRISKLYSKALEEIFGVNKISGEDFSNFMRPLIIPRDLEALEMFMRHLFNDDMDEEVVTQLNPIEQVKIYHEKDGIITTKYIRVNFTRIWRKDQIINVMVTVSDETESILLQQHLEEAEKKKKRETEQVLSILKIDPSLMRGFLYNAKRTLRGISQKYETNKNKNLKPLLDFTFETVHNLKGNAAVIGLEIMSRKFHDIEDLIDKLNKQPNVSGKDFLTILYEIDDADKMIEDMGSMLRKVADIYRKYPTGGHVVSNIMLIDTLERAVKVTAEKLEKQVDFFFKNDKNIVLPNDYIASFRDIMIQLIRNSVKHGIEEQHVRVLRGKLIRGTISIEINQPEEKVLEIVYSDDGEGLDLHKIKEKAVLKGLISEFEAEKLSREDTIALIYTQGFSTVEEVDEMAGRGQGMSLVRTLITDMKGTFEVDFEQGQYFNVIIRLPMTQTIQIEPSEHEASDS